ncbi:MAG: NGG1p interacting factor NIF3 [Xanthomonadaceae bacterium]|mgnify:FL=1|nr:NGG1p interacting factor NIF3 [Xanthomonadaceae bacterium]
MYKLVFFVPDSHVEEVKEAIFATGAGKIGNYSHCSWQTLGQGQFKPLQGSDPFSGIQGNLSRCEEWRVELVLEKSLAKAAITALKKAHPYETPAFDLIELIDPF